jgi:hypothetical protein
MPQRTRKGWTVETIQRHVTIMIIYFDNQVRGQVEIHSKEEEKAWFKAIETLRRETDVERVTERPKNG